MKRYEIITTIDANEYFTSRTGEIDNLISGTKLIDPFSSHDIDTSVNTHQRGSNQIDFIFATPIINKYCNSFGITTFDAVTLSNNCGLYIDIDIQ